MWQNCIHSLCLNVLSNMLYMERILETCQERTFPQPPPKTQKVIVDKLSKFYSQMQTGKYFLYLYKIWTKNYWCTFHTIRIANILELLKNSVKSRSRELNMHIKVANVCIIQQIHKMWYRSNLVPINQCFDILLDSLFMIYLSLHSLAIYCSKMSEIALL